MKDLILHPSVILVFVTGIFSLLAGMQVSRLLSEWRAARETADKEGIDSRPPRVVETLDIVSALLMGKGRDRILDQLLETVSRLLRVKQVAVFIPSRSQNSVIVLTACGFDPAVVETLELDLDLDGGNITESVRSLQPIAQPDPGSSPLTFPIAMPITSGRVLVGILGIADAATLDWSKSQFDLLSQVRDLVELSLTKAGRIDESSLNEDAALETAAVFKSALGSYVSPAIAELIESNPDSIHVEGELREVTVLFADIIDFTKFCEFAPPRVLLKRLNEYLEVMANLVLSHQGTIDKFVGDQIMAYWNAPLDQADHAMLALQAAAAMHQAQGPLGDAWQKIGRTPLRMGMSLNSGPVVFGSMGTDRKMEITILGDTVNLGARLEKLTRIHDVPMILGPRTRDLIGDRLDIRQLGMTSIKGKSEEIAVFGLSSEEVNSWILDRSSPSATKARGISDPPQSPDLEIGDV